MDTIGRMDPSSPGCIIARFAVRHRLWRIVSAATSLCPLLFAVVFAAPLLPPAAHAKDYSIRSRDIGCAELGFGRSRQICEAIAASLTWQWMGHAIVASGYKPSFEGIRNVYCALKIGKSDVALLEDLKKYDPNRKSVPDWRLESGADILLRMVISRDGTADEPENSIFSPKNPDYLLQQGTCP